MLSSTYSALRCGAISLSKALTIADATSHLGLDAQHAVEEKVLTRAPNQTNAALKASVRRAVARVDARREAERHKDAVNDRQCRIVPLGDGMAGLWITHTADKIRVLYAAIQALANAAKTPPPDAEPEQAKPEEDGPEQAQPEREEPCGAGSATPTSGATSTATAGSGTAGSGTAGCAAGSGTAGSGTTGGEGTSAEGSQDGVDTETGTAPGRYRDDRTAEQRRADVAVEVFECILSNGLDWLGRKLPDQHRRRPHIEVLVPVTTLLGMDDNPCELTGYGPIPAEMARAIATDGTWRRILTDPVTGEVVEAATTRYQPGVQVTETLLARYPVCDWFGCNRPARECERDHTEKFLNSGITKLQDLRPRCKNHHTIKDTEAWGWKATADPDGGTTFSAPTGHRYRTTPATPGPIADDYRNDTASYAPGTSSDDHDDTPPF